MNIEERIERLERDLRRSRIANRVFGGILLLAMAGVVAVAVWPVNPVTRTIRANAISIEDKNGKTRIGLHNDSGFGPELVLFDENDKIRFGVRIVPQIGAQLAMMDENGKPKITLISDQQSGSSLAFLDKKGVSRSSFGSVETAFSDGNKITNPESTLQFFGPDGKVILRMP